MSAPFLLETNNLSRSFGGLKAVHNVDFRLRSGEIRAIIGPNGAGKTTLVGLICGRIAATSGTVMFGGSDISRLPAHRRVRAGIAYTFQVTSIFPNLTVQENVALAMVHGAGPEQSALAVLDDVGLSAYAQSRAGDLAYGHQRLVEIAMGLALNPRLLILDEPTQGLSDGDIERFISLMRRVAQDRTLLLIEHNMDVVMALAGRITVMERGRILAEGSPDDIRANADVQRAYLGVQP